MADKVEVCMCEKCGNEAEMTISCQWVDVQAHPEKPGKNKKKPGHAKSAVMKPT